MPVLPTTPTLAINGSFLVKPVTGVQRYAREMMAALAAQHPGQLAVLAPAGAIVPPEWPVVAIHDERRARLRPALWEQLRLPILFRRSGARLLWSPSNIGPMSLREHAVTLHDASVFAGPQWFSWQFRLWHRFVQRVVARRSRLVMTVSEFSEAELRRHGLVGPERAVHVVHCAVGGEIAAAAARPAPPREPFVLFVGSVEPRKNLRSLLEAWCRIPASERGEWRLKIAGGAAKSFAQVVLPQVADAAVDFLGYVSDEDLIALYRRASLFAYLSEYEGFGLPPLEAMSLGTPTLLSDIAVFRELYDGAASFVPPGSAAAIAAELSSLMHDEARRAALSEAGQSRALRYDWGRSAERLWAACMSTMEQGHAP
jgi:glycosyltransferase involved in cell wall biosynthesis